MLNPFFQQGSKTEQNLIQDLINEQLKIYGVEVYYLPRKYVTSKTVIKELIESKFENAYPIEAYVDTYDGYNGLGTLMTKFGIQDLDDLVITISRERFETYISPLIKNIPNIELSTRPKEGDLIYFPLGDRLFEIKYVEHEKPFYQLQKNYVYQLTCELFRYEDELLNTGIDNIDDNVVESGYVQSLTLVGSSIPATATAATVNGGIRRIIVTNRGSGYKSSPRVAISSAPSGGLTATAVVKMISDIVDCNGTVSDKVQEVQIINSGYGYTVAPSISFIGGGGSGAQAIAELANGIIGQITITNGGSGYISPPTIDIDPPELGIGTGGKAVSSINSVGIVTSIRITDSGFGYLIASGYPNITISPPDIIGIGTYKVGEVVTGSISSTTAVVNSWNSLTNELKVSKISGSFVSGEFLVGTASSASRQLRFIQEFNTMDTYAENTDIETEADKIIDFSEKNPFGNP